jgi:DNA-binding MarR family transcriptional regulator
MPSTRTPEAAAPSPPDGRLGFLLYRAGLAVARGYERALKPIDGSPVEAGILSTLAYQGPSHTRALARLLGLGRQTISNVTKRLEHRDFIRRLSDERDSRLALFEISPAGRRHLAEIETIASGFDAMLRDLVGEGGERQMADHLRTLLASPELSHED